jgi:hypothetical protein
MFETAKPEPSGTDSLKCPDGFKLVNTANSAYTAKLGGSGPAVFAECLKVRPGMVAAAAFLESRRVAAIRGATPQFEKQEGFTFDPLTKRAYFSVARITKGMINDTKHTFASGWLGRFCFYFGAGDRCMLLGTGGAPQRGQAPQFSPQTLSPPTSLPAPPPPALNRPL